MKITPLEIRQKGFEKNFRGYDKDEVNGFLLSLSQEWERMLDETRDLRFKLEATQREVEKLRQVESSLYKTLKTAEDTGANMIDQANKTADLNLRESKMKAESIVNEAKLKGKSIVENAEGKARSIIGAMEEEVKILKQRHKKAEGELEDLLFELKNVAHETLKKVEKAEAQKSDRMKRKIEESEQLTEEFNHFKFLEDIDKNAAETEENEVFETSANVEENFLPEPVEKEEEVNVEATPGKKSRSFFDDIG